MTQYALQFEPSAQEYANTHSLYDYVKMYTIDQNTAKNKKYETNLALFQNISIFELLNFENFNENISFLQNKWFNELLLTIDFDIEYDKFYDYLINLNHDVVNNFKLSNDEKVIDYLKSDKIILNEYIYNFLVLNDYYSPYHIYNEILSFINKKNEITSYLDINFDNIKNKIIVYLFVVFVIKTNIKKLLINNYKINKEIYLEYNFPNNQVVFKVSDVLQQSIIDIVDQYINYTFDDEISTTTSLEVLFSSINNNTINSQISFDKFAINYILSFDIIGTNDINTNSLLFANNLTISNNIQNNISKLVMNNNIIINNDTNINNANKYNLTILATNKLTMFYENFIYDIDDKFKNEIFYKSDFIDLKHIYYNKTDINSFNLLLNLQLTYLSHYNITNDNVNDSVNNIINYMRLFNKNYVNDSLETFKGLSTNYDIAIDFIDNATLSNENNMFLNTSRLYSRATNIEGLTNLSNYSMSLITPNDYDYNAININFNNIYSVDNTNVTIEPNKSLNIYQKYYNYDYNYYNYENNFIGIYNYKFTYYEKIIKNGNTINIIKNNYNLYISMFIDIIYTMIAKSVYIDKILTNDNTQVKIFNTIIDLYLRYNFTFKTNTYLTNIENLKLQTTLLNTNTFSTLSQINKYITQLYYYELFSSDIENINLTTVEGDFINFMNQISISINYNFNYNNNLYNIVYKFYISLLTIIYYINKNYYTTTVIDEQFIISIINTFISDVSNINVISLFLETISINYNFILYQKIVNIININNFIDKFSLAVKGLIYYNSNDNSSKIITNMYNEYFKDVVFYYREYAVNDTEIKEFTLSLKEFNELFLLYITWYFNNDFYVESLTYEKILKLFGNIYTNNEINNTIINDFTQEHHNNFAKFIFTFILEVLLNTYYGMTFNINSIYYKNTLLSYQILFLNSYYFIINKNTSLLNVNVFDEVANINSNTINKLQILYRIKILLIVTENNTTYDDIMKKILIDSHQYICNGTLTDTINIANDFSTTSSLVPYSQIGYNSVYFDYLNKNIIQGNIINNYYKDIQNNTIKSNINYGIKNFMNNDVTNLFLTNIYNKIFSLNKTETDIGVEYFDNSIESIFNNYKVYNRTNNYVLSVFQLINTQIDNKLNIYKNTLGGVRTFNVVATPALLLSIFKKINKKMNKINKTNNIGENFETIMTFIYNNYSNYPSNYDYNMSVILFYYNCMLVFITTSGSNYININEIIKYLIPLIYEKIIDFNNNKPDEIFFNGLNKILFNVENNGEFINSCNTFFIFLIQNLSLENNILGITDVLRGGFIDFEKMILTKYIKNSKINTWKYMIPYIVDYNNSNVIKNWKSIDEEPIIKIQNDYMIHITKINDGIVNKNGILQLIENIQLMIGEENIDLLSSQMYNVIHELFINDNVLKGYNDMIGGNDDNVFNGLKPYIKQFQKRKYIVPLEFYFNRNMNSIPLISCMYLDTIIRVRLKTKNIIKNTYTVNNVINMNDYQTSMSSDYVLVERDQRIKISNKTIDNLINVHGNHSLTKIVSLNSGIIIENNREIAKVSFDFEMGGIVKELFWTIELFVNELPIEIPISSGDSYIINTLLFIDDNLRDGINKVGNYNSLTTTINKYKYNTRANNTTTFNTYSFALNPEEFQPSGTLNMNVIKNFTITPLIDVSKIKQFITGTNDFVVKINLNNVAYNLIRYQAGLAGLMYVNT